MYSLSYAHTYALILHDTITLILILIQAIPHKSLHLHTRLHSHKGHLTEAETHDPGTNATDFVTLDTSKTSLLTDLSRPEDPYIYRLVSHIHSHIRLHISYPFAYPFALT